jgi:hypothetical protein
MNPVLVSIGHTVSCTIVYLDQNGNPMLTPPTPDAPPTWADSTPATGTLTASANGLTASELAVAAGADTITVNLAVGGKPFSASIPIEVQAAPQVLTSIEIAATVA